jgi:hypothetical protein
MSGEKRKWRIWHERAGGDGSIKTTSDRGQTAAMGGVAIT